MPSLLPNLLNERLATVAALEAKDVIAQYVHLRAFESDFDKAQSSLRTIASGWLLATIGGLGLITQNQFVGQSTLDPSIAADLRQALLLFATLGLASLWYLDQRVYQSLLHSVFSLGCHLELAASNLLPIRTRTYLLHLDITPALGMFYLVPIAVLAAAALLNLFQASVGLHNAITGLYPLSMPSVRPINMWVVSGIIALAHLAFFCWLLWRSRRWATLSGQLPDALRERP